MKRHVTQIVARTARSRTRPDTALLASARRAAAQRAQSAQLEITRSLVPLAACGNALAGCALFCGRDPAASSSALAAWAALLASSIALMLFFRFSYRRDAALQEGRVAMWRRFAALMALVDGAFCAVGAFTFITPDGIPAAAAVALAIAVSWPAFSGSGPSLILFALPAAGAFAYVLGGLSGMGTAAALATAAAAGAVLALAGRQLGSVFARLIEADTEKERLVEQLRAEKRLSERALKASHTAIEDRARFFAGANHDLRQPMQAMGIFIQLLKKRASPEAAPIIGQIDAAARSMASLVEEILEISRIDSGTVRPVIATVPLAPLFAQLAGEFEQVAAGKGVVFRAEYCDAAVQTDEVLFTRVLRNLCGNAVHHTDREGAEVLLSARMAGPRMVEVTVRDSGPGIPAGEQLHIFEAFYRGKSARRRGGYGLGLSIVRSICRMLEVPLSLESRMGEGTAFIMEFPLADAAAAGEAGAGRELDAAGIEPMAARVLLVDDDAMIRRSLAELLAQWGCTVRQAAGFDAALVRGMKDEPCDIVVTDHNLGDEVPTGLEGLFALADAGCVLPSVILTAIPADELAAQHAAILATRRREGRTPVLLEMPAVLQKPTDAAALNRAMLRQLEAAGGKEQ